MEVLILTAFVSLVLVLSSILFFAWNVRQRSHEHADRLALLPLQEETCAPGAGAPNCDPITEPPDGTDLGRN